MWRLFLPSLYWEPRPLLNHFFSLSLCLSLLSVGMYDCMFNGPNHACITHIDTMTCIIIATFTQSRQNKRMNRSRKVWDFEICDAIVRASLLVSFFMDRVRGEYKEEIQEYIEWIPFTNASNLWAPKLILMLWWIGRHFPKENVVVHYFGCVVYLKNINCVHIVNLFLFPTSMKGVSKELWLVLILFNSWSLILAFPSIDDWWLNFLWDKFTCACNQYGHGFWMSIYGWFWTMHGFPL